MSIELLGYDTRTYVQSFLVDIVRHKKAHRIPVVNYCNEAALLWEARWAGGGGRLIPLHQIVTIS